MAHMLYGIKMHGNINEAMQEFMLKKIDMCEKNRKIRGIVLDVNSGGGSASASEMIYNRIKEFSKHKDVYSIITGAAASGAYMVISPSKKIYSIETAIVGSIGVYSIMPDFSGLMEKLGLKVRQTKMGKHKNANNPFEPPDEEASRGQEEIINGIYDIFIKIVRENRKLSDEQVKLISDSDIFIARRSLELGLIDSVRSYGDSIREIMKESNERREPFFETPRAPFIMRFLDRFI